MTTATKDYFREYMAARERAERAEALLCQLAEGRDLRRAEHVRLLGVKIQRLRQQMRQMQVKAEEHNRTVFATGLVGNCTGCDAGAPHNFQSLTEERVREVEILAARLRAWWNTHNWRNMHPAR